MSAAQTNAEKLGIAEGSLLWLVGDSIEELALLDPLPEGVETYLDKAVEASENWSDTTWAGLDNEQLGEEPVKPDGVDTAVIAVSNAHEFNAMLDDVLPRIGSIRQVWVLFAAAELPLSDLRHGVGEYGWGGLEPISLDETWSAVELAQP